MRPPIHATLMEIAATWAKRSTCSARVAVGAVLVNDDMRVVAAGFNGSPSGFPHCNDIGCLFDDGGHCMNAIHAEENTILQCAVEGVSTRGLTMYVTHSPCRNCALRISQAGITTVVFYQVYGNLFMTREVFLMAGVHLIRLNKRGHLYELL